MPFNIRMVDQIRVKPLGIIKDLNVFVHGIAYIITFTIINNNVLN